MYNIPKRPTWCNGQLYAYYFKYNKKVIILDRKWHKDEFLIASSLWKPLKAAFYVRDKYWEGVHSSLRYLAKKNIIKPNYGEIISWRTVFQWYRNARKALR